MSGRSTEAEFRPLTHQQTQDRRQNRLRIVESIVIGDSENPQARVFQPLLSSSIILITIVVTSSIDLDHELVGDADIIHDIRADRVLTSKLETQEPTVSEQPPEATFGECGVFSQPARGLSCPQRRIPGFLMGS